MKRYYITAAAVCLVLLIAACLVYRIGTPSEEQGILKIGFIYDNDESAPYTYNFYLAQSAIEKDYGNRIEVLSRSNVPESEADLQAREMIGEGCKLIFTNSYSPKISETAAEYPEVQFCQVSYQPKSLKGTPSNYHTFKGSVYQGRYISGIAAGMKMRELIREGRIREDEAKVGYVAAFQSEEVISGFTAFLLGIRQIVPTAVMRVKYTGTWNDYTQEKACAAQMISEGCVVISQHTDTIGPAVACEEYQGSRPVIHVGYNQSMIDTAPNTSLIASRINWTPYISGAVKAVLEGKRIEDCVEGTAWGRDMGAGFERGWVEMLELNKAIAAPGTEARIQAEIEKFRTGRVPVFLGDYTGVDPDDPADTVSLKEGYIENAHSSSPSFHYILTEFITVGE